jgi:hypothetical protein
MREPHGGNVPQHGKKLLAIGLSPQALQRFEQRQIRLARPKVLDALPCAYPEGKCRGRLGQKLAHQRGLTNAWIPRDEDELQSPLLSLL